MSHDTEATSSKRKLRKYDSAIDTRCAFETNDLNLTTANFEWSPFFSHMFMCCKKHTSFLLQSLFSALAAVWSVNSHGSNDTLP
jgi:hypothetical protein